MGEMMNSEEIDAELEYWVQQGLVTVDSDDMYRITDEGMKDPIVSAVFDTMFVEELTSLVTVGYLECWWDEEAGDMMYKVTEEGLKYLEDFKE